jgi:hypothetical protein
MIRPAPPIASSMILRYPLQVVATADQANIVKHINNTGIAVAAFVAAALYSHASRPFTMDLIFSPYLLSVA